MFATISLCFYVLHTMKSFFQVSICVVYLATHPWNREPYRLGLSLRQVGAILLSLL